MRKLDWFLAAVIGLFLAAAVVAQARAAPPAPAMTIVRPAAS
ncbi:MAG: hypothetical protein ACHP7N_17290 [Caulobacterales bacterium]